MNESYDPGTHLLVIALIAFYWSLLRIWQQPPPRESDKKPPEKQTVAGPTPEMASASLRELIPTTPSLASHPMPLVPTSDFLAVLHEAHQEFDEKAFLAGAALAYEFVVNAYAEEDFEVLQGLLGPQASRDFEQAITARRTRGEKLSFTFIGIKNMDVVRTWCEAEMAEVTVRFTSEAVVATFAASGAVVDGDPNRIVEVSDEWTFARALDSMDPNWRLVAT